MNGYVPADFACRRVDTLVTQASKNTRALGQGPDAIVFQTSSEADHVEEEDLTWERVGTKALLEHEMPIVPCAEFEKGKDPDQASCELPHGGSTTARDLSLLASRGLLGRVNCSRHVKHGAVDPGLVLVVVERRTRHEGREEKDVTGVVQEAWQVDNSLVLLEV